MNDIVKRLRIEWDTMGEMGNAERVEAADEIEQLRAQIAAWNLSSQQAARDLSLAADEIEMLRAQRDDARKEVCEWCALFTKETPESVASKNEWNCFGDNA